MARLERSGSSTGILASQQPLVDLDAAGNSQIAKLPPSEVAAIEIIGGAKFGIGDVKVTAIENSHYGFKLGTTNAAAYQSLSLRFDMTVGVASALRNRSIVYTGDTGPSDAVEKLAQGTNLLISEITDPDSELASLKAERTDIPFFAYPILKNHFKQQHLTADAVGKLAAAAGVGSLVLTHNPILDHLIPQARATIASHYGGSVAFANDLQNY